MKEITDFINAIKRVYRLKLDKIISCNYIYTMYIYSRKVRDGELFGARLSLI